MATYKPQFGIDFCKQMVSSMPLDRIQNRMVQQISDFLWYASPFRWTVGNVTAVPIVAGTHDYTITKPADFEYIVQAYATDGVTEKPLKIESFLPIPLQTGNVSTICVLNGTTTLRVSPIPGVQDRTWTIVITYKKTSPQIPRSDFSIPGVLGIPDQWATVFEEGLLWKSFAYAYDERAGEMTKDDKGNIKYSGQTGVFMTALERMKESEKTLTDMSRAIVSPDRMIG